MIKSSNRLPDEAYFMEGRTRQNTSPYQYGIGTKVKFNRYIIRVGYKIEMQDFTFDEKYQCGIQIFAEKNGLVLDEAKKLIKSLKLYNPFKGYRHEIYRRLVEQKREEMLVQSNKDKAFEYKWRHLWFIDAPEGWQGEIIGKQRKWTGVPRKNINHEGFTTELHPRYNQNLYVVGYGTKTIQHYGFYSKEYWNNETLVHPDDIEVIDNE